jgi:hypothetical protein
MAKDLRAVCACGCAKQVNALTADAGFNPIAASLLGAI